MNTRIERNLRHLRESSGRTKSWVANQLGKTETAVRNYETGKTGTPVPVIEAYAELFGIRAGRILDEDLWLLPPNDMMVEEPSVNYGKRIEREKDLLHDRLDSREAKLASLRRQIEDLARQMKTDDSVKAEYLATVELLATMTQDPD